MEQEQKKEPVDVANEPVDRNDDAEFMDTGVLHEDRPCTSCGEQPAVNSLCATNPIRFTICPVCAS